MDGDDVPFDARRKEIITATDWAPLLAVSQAPPVPSKKVLGGSFPDAFDIHGLLADTECASIIAAAEESGFGTTNYPKQYRGNLRLIVDDCALAEALWPRLAPLVPAKITSNGSEWNATGLNSRWRLSKYYPEDQFEIHVDASFNPSSSRRSMYTVNIYLNGGFEGGATRFYDDSTADDVLEHSITPLAGRAVVFRQPPDALYAHDGEKVTSGIKYLLRTDVLYELNS